MRDYLKISIADLQDMVAYDPSTGSLTWKRRSLRFFSNARACAVWNGKYAGKPAFSRVSTGGYLRGFILSCGVSSHRVAWAIAHGRWPEGHIDHIDGDRTNNRLANLREVTQVENNRSLARSKRNKSGQTGVRFYAARRKWQAILQGRHLGYFETFEQAVAARKSAERTAGFSDRHGASLLRPHMPALMAIIAQADELRGAA